MSHITCVRASNVEPKINGLVLTLKNFPFAPHPNNSLATRLSCPTIKMRYVLVSGGVISGVGKGQFCILGTSFLLERTPPSLFAGGLWRKSRHTDIDNKCWPWLLDRNYWYGNCINPRYSSLSRLMNALSLFGWSLAQDSWTQGHGMRPISLPNYTSFTHIGSRQLWVILPWPSSLSTYIDTW